MDPKTETMTRRPAREMLALIVLAELPMPRAVRFHPSGEILSLNLDTLADGKAWSQHLGGHTDTYLNTGDGRTYLDEGIITWHGWSVHLHASELIAPDTTLDQVTTTQLQTVAGGAR